MRSILRIAALAVLLAVAMPASASALNATNARVGSQAGFVRVVVDFSGGTFEVNDAEAVDPFPSDGTARVEVRRRGVTTRAIDTTAHGVRVRVSQGSDRIVIRLTGARRAFKYLRITGLHGPERLVLDLYGAKPPSAAAEIRTGRRSCLRLTTVSPDGRGFRVRGVERELFEGAFVVRVRDAAGRVVGTRGMTARGAWSLRVAYRVTRAGAGTLELTAGSAKDGSLDCLVQVRVGLNP